MADQVLFWNVQRSGKSPEKLGKYIEIILRIAKKYSRNNLLVVLCEVTSTVMDYEMKYFYDDDQKYNFDIVKSVNLNKSQLGYASFLIGKDRKFQSRSINTVNTDDFDTVYGRSQQDFGIKKGKVFYKPQFQSNRKVGNIAGTNVCVIHSLANKKARYLTPWAASSIGKNNNQFILVGDFNCEPDDLWKYLIPNNIGYRYDSATHNAFKGLSSIYDYVFFKGYTVAIKTIDYKKMFWMEGFEYISDHLPIIVQFE